MVVTTLVSKAVVMDHAHNVLLLRRSKTDPRRPLQWDFPGGLVENNESFAVGCSREIQEEVGITIDPKQLIPLKAESSVFDRGDEKVNAIWLYYYVVLENVPHIQLSFEHDTFQWVTLQKALEVHTYVPHQGVLRYLIDNQLLEAPLTAA